MKATYRGSLAPIERCHIHIPGAGTIRMNNMPDVSDSKSAVYNNEGIIGRSFPLYTYSYSGDRTINMQIHFFIINEGDGRKNLQHLRWIQSAVYPQDPNLAGAQSSNGAPYKPPPVCSIQCGDMLSQEPLCALLQSYSVKFPTEVAFDVETYCPFRFDVDTNWLIVYTSSDLPFQDRIVRIGR